MMRVFIAGATGVLGRRVVRRLITEGHDVTGLARSAQNEEFLRHEGARIARTDIFDGKALGHYVSGHDAVLHLATSIPRGARPRRRDWATNDALRTRGTEALIQAALANHVKVYVQESIVHLYNRYDGSEVDELVQPAPGLPYSLRSALSMEKMIEEQVKRNGLPAITLRFGGFYGHDAHNSLWLINGVRNRSIPLLGKGEAVWNLIHLDDAAEAVFRALASHEGNTGRVFNIVDDHPVTMRELLTTIALLTGSPMPGAIPVGVAKVFAGRDAVRFMQISFRASNRAAKSALGWQPRYSSVHEGLRHVLDMLNGKTSDNNRPIVATHAGVSPVQHP